MTTTFSFVHRTIRSLTVFVFNSSASDGLVFHLPLFISQMHWIYILCETFFPPAHIGLAHFTRFVLPLMMIKIIRNRPQLMPRITNNFNCKTIEMRNAKCHPLCSFNGLRLFLFHSSRSLVFTVMTLLSISRHHRIHTMHIHTHIVHTVLSGKTMLNTRSPCWFAKCGKMKTTIHAFHFQARQQQHQQNATEYKLAW